MKLVMAILQPSRLEAVKEALIGAGVQGMTLSPAGGFEERAVLSPSGSSRAAPWEAPGSSITCGSA